MKKFQLFFLPFILLIFLSCTLQNGSGIRTAENYLNAEKYDEAIKILSAELQKNPRDKELQIALLRAKLNKFYSHLIKARQLARQPSQKKEALEQYNLALQVFPDNYELQREIDILASPGKESEQEKATRINPPVELKVKKDQKFSFKLRNVQMTNIFRSLGNLFKINFVFDRDFRDFPHTVELESTTFFSLLDSLCLAAAARYRIVNETTVLIYPDNFAKKMQLEQKGIHLFYLSNIKADEAKKMLQSIYRNEQLIMQEDTTLNALAVRADYETLTTIDRFLKKLDRPRSEVELNLEIMEINRSLMQKIGSDLSNWGAGFSALNSEGKSNFNLKDFSASYIISLPSAFLNLLENWEGNKIIARPNLRGISGEEISFAVGDEVPIPETQFQAIAAGGINSSPVTTYKYQKVGLEIKLTPTVHQNNEITIKSKLTLKFISGSGYSAAFPILGTREVENQIRLKDGEINIIGGFIRDDVRKSLKGFPALSRIPILGALFGSSDDSVKQTDLIFVIKPKIIRKQTFSRKDLEVIWSEASAGEEIETGIFGGTFADEGTAGRAPAEPYPPSKRDEDIPLQPAEEAEGAIKEEPIQKVPEDQLLKLEVFPPQLTTSANRDATLTFQISGKDIQLTEITINGEIVGGKARIAQIIGDFLANSRYQKNISGQSFNINILISRPLNIKQNPVLLAQLLTSFESRGDYQLVISSVSAFDKNGAPLTVIYQPVSIKVN